MSNDCTKRYDSFVIRVWRETASGRLLRAEVDHVQSGAVHIGRNTGLAWIQHTLHKVLGRNIDDEDCGADPPTSIPDG